MSFLLLPAGEYANASLKPCYVPMQLGLHVIHWRNQLLHLGMIEAQECLVAVAANPKTGEYVFENLAFFEQFRGGRHFKLRFKKPLPWDPVRISFIADMSTGKRQSGGPVLQGLTPRVREALGPRPKGAFLAIDYGGAWQRDRLDISLHK